VHLHIPIDVRSASLALLAVLAALFSLPAASAVFIPLCPGLAVSYALSPLWIGWSGCTARARSVLRCCWAPSALPRSGRLTDSLTMLAGPTFAQKRITVLLLDEITGQIHRCLLVQLATSMLVSIVTWLTLLAIGLDPAAVWGVVAFVQFRSINMAMLVDGSALVIRLLSGNLLMPWLIRRISRINTVTVFVGVLGFGWLWGVWGLLLGVPILTTMKAICDRVDDLKPVGELLGT